MIHEIKGLYMKIKEKYTKRIIHENKEKIHEKRIIHEEIDYT